MNLSRTSRRILCGFLLFLLLAAGLFQWQARRTGTNRPQSDAAATARGEGPAEGPASGGKGPAARNRGAGDESGAPVSAGGSPRTVGLGGFPEGVDWETARVEVSKFSVPYFEERKELEILTNRIAVFSSVDSDLSSSGNEVLRGRGIRDTDAAAHPIAGWTIAQTVNALGGNSGPDAIARIIRLVEDISSDGGGRNFSSPVFRDPELGGLLVVTPVILMGFREGATLDERLEAISSVPDLDSVVEEQGLDLFSSYLKIPVEAAQTAFEVFERVNVLASHAAVRFVEPDMIFEGYGQLIPNDPAFAQCWGLRNTGQSGGQVDFDMDAELAWDTTIGEASVKVLIIDTGVQQNHPDINQLTGKDFTSERSSSPDGDPVNEFDRHGTPVAGAVSAIINNNTGSVGVAPGVKSISARCFISTNTGGSWTASYSWTADAINWAVGQGVQVTNNSNGYGGTSSAIESSYQSTRNNGMVHFASAGNGGTSNLGYPARLAPVYGVASCDRYGNKASSSQYGTGLAFSAPGVSIRLPDRTGADGYSSGDLAWMNGTSFASPYAAGVAALIYSVAPNLTPAEVDNIFESTSTDLGAAGYDTTFGWGLVNANEAVTLAKQTADDSYEENDTRLSAFDLSQSAGIWLESLSGEAVQSDDDWYEITSPAGFPRITVDCEFTDSEGNIDMSLHDAAGNPVAVATTTTDDEVIDVLVPNPGTYFIRVHGENFDTGYDLRWRNRAAPYLNLSMEEVEFPDSGGGGNVSVSSNTDWTWSQSGGAGWLSIAESSPQSGNQTFSYFLLSNSSVIPRTATVTFTNGFDSVLLELTQLGVPPTLDLGQESVSFDESANSGSFQVSSNTSWTWRATAGGEWLNTAESGQQNGNQSFAYTVEANPVVPPRQIVIEFTNGTQTRSHTITQAGIPPEGVTDVMATRAGGEAIFVSWTPAPAATEYQVWRGTAATFNSMTLLGTTTELSFTDSEALTGLNYYYRVVSGNVNAMSGDSAEALGKRFGPLDAAVQRPGRSTRYGDDVYATMVGQSVTYRTRKKGPSLYRIYLENESDNGSEIVGATSRKGNRKFKAKYTSSYAGGNVTATITTGRFLTRSFFDRSEVISLVVKPTRVGKNRRGGISFLARTWLHELPETGDFVRAIHKKVR